MRKNNAHKTARFLAISASLALVCTAIFVVPGCADESRDAQSEGTSQIAQLNAVLDTIPDIIFYKDLDGVYLGGNTAWQELTGQSSEFLGKTDFDLFPADVAAGFREADKAMLAGLETTRN